MVGLSMSGKSTINEILIKLDALLSDISTNGMIMQELFNSYIPMKMLPRESLLLTAIGAWVYGRWSVPIKSKRTQWAARGVASVLITSAFAYGLIQVNNAAENIKNTTVERSSAWAPWSNENLQAALSNGNPVFVDFTATWCLICQVNKKIALRTQATDSLFKKYGIVAMEADWTRHDPAITQELEKFGRSGVPLYVLYLPDGQVSVLPQNLTNGKIAEAVKTALD